MLYAKNCASRKLTSHRKPFKLKKILKNPILKIELIDPNHGIILLSIDQACSITPLCKILWRSDRYKEISGLRPAPNHAPYLKSVTDRKDQYGSATFVILTFRTITSVKLDIFGWNLGTIYEKSSSNSLWKKNHVFWSRKKIGGKSRKKGGRIKPKLC